MRKEDIPHQVYDMQSICINPDINYGFLRGAGGTGKSYTIGAFVKIAKIPQNEYLFIGPTGKSVSVAEEKGLTGNTISSFFNVLTYQTTDTINAHIIKKFKSFKQFYKEMRKKLAEIKYIFIDEVSMVNEEFLFFVLQTILESGIKVQCTFMAGDYHQLSPIGKVSHSRNLIHKLVEIEQLKFIDFNTRYRSTNETFNEFLFDFRNGTWKKDSKTIANYLKHFFNVIPTNDMTTIPNYQNYTTITFKGVDVDNINYTLLEQLPTHMHHSEIKIIEDVCHPNDMDIRNKIINDFQYDKNLYFKEGAKILFRVNDPDSKFKNGDEGVIESIYNTHITIRKKVPLSFNPNGEVLIDVKKHTYHTTDLEEEAGIKLVIEQWPFSIGYARTIHKSQGDGFSNLFIDLSFLEMSALTNIDKWQLLYVTISRVINPGSTYISQQSLDLLSNCIYTFKDIDYDALSLDSPSAPIMFKNTYLPRKNN